MATCPDCGASSRVDPTFTLERVYVAQPITEVGLAGNQLKVAAREMIQMTHETCGWSVRGHIEGDHLVVDPKDSNA